MVSRPNGAADSDAEHSIFDKTNLTNFSDAVMAIAITIIVLELQVPDVPTAEINAQLWSSLWNDSSVLIGYFVAFFILASYWKSYHKYMKYVKRVDDRFVTLNIFFVFFLAILPFPTSILCKYPAMTGPVILYAIAISCSSIMQFLMWDYASGKGKLTVDMDSRFRHAMHTRPLLNVALFLISIPVAFINPLVSMAMWCIPFLITNYILHKVYRLDTAASVA